MKLSTTSLLIVSALAVCSEAATSACMDVSVQGDATFCITGPICAGTKPPAATAKCPVKGDKATKACGKGAKSYVASSGQCVATTDATCQLLKSGAYGCVWGSAPTTVPVATTAAIKAATTTTTTAPVATTKAATTTTTTTAPVATTKAATTTATTTTAPVVTTKATTTASAVSTTTTTAVGTTGCTQVSVEGDATYCIAGPICSGSGAAPAGTKCPVVSNIAVKDCYKYLKSYNTATSQCAAPVNATCQKIKTGAYGCVWAPVTTATSSSALSSNATSTNSTASNSTSTIKNTTTTTVGKAIDEVGVDFMSEDPSTATTANAATVAVVGTIGALAAVIAVLVGVYQHKRSSTEPSVSEPLVLAATPEFHPHA